MSGLPIGVCEDQLSAGTKYLGAVAGITGAVIAAIHPSVAEGNGLHFVASGDIKFAGVKPREVASDHVRAVHSAPPLAGAAGWLLAEDVGAEVVT